ncbi:MAG: 50S ribosomal protein L6 [candidate division SR1 bacterium]|nr:50S ribosomal protein L6 [candidate division SR1 bacterium]
MSKVGKKVIALPTGVETTLQGQLLSVKGPKGTLSYTLLDGVQVTIADSELTVFVADEEKRNLRGLTRTLVANMVEGVANGYEKKLMITGVGYGAKLEGKKLILSIGYSHKVDFVVPQSIEVAVEQDIKGNTIVTMKGIDKQYLGEVAAKLKALKKPEPYKGKGIRYFDEYIKLKPGKATKK